MIGRLFVGGGLSSSELPWSLVSWFSSGRRSRRLAWYVCVVCLRRRLVGCLGWMGHFWSDGVRFVGTWFVHHDLVLVTNSLLSLWYIDTIHDLSSSVPRVLRGALGAIRPGVVSVVSILPVIFIRYVFGLVIIVVSVTHTRHRIVRCASSWSGTLDHHKVRLTSQFTVRFIGLSESVVGVNYRLSLLLSEGSLITW